MASPTPSDTIISKNPISSGGNIDFTAGSGTLVSGVLQPLGGPWYIETQTLDINYVRIPLTAQASSVTTTLTGSQTADSAVQVTRIAYWCEATYDTVVQYQNYNTSSFQQPQVFELQAASADINGVTYGAITSATMGAMGTIKTTQPFMRRTPYVSGANQPLVSRHKTPSNYGAFKAAVLDPNRLMCVSATAEDLSQHFYDLGWWKDHGCRAGTARYGSVFAGVGGDPIFAGVAAYSIPGAYATSKESLSDIQAFIRGVGLKITNERLHSYPICDLRTIYVGGGTGPGVSYQGPLKDQGFVEYDINRHA
jgi:hypothetical protein|tara:strand:- start:690 stop:1616 length:927 start_codon:yes stop_codon:yes gene_type:complete